MTSRTICKRKIHLHGHLAILVFTFTLCSLGSGAASRQPAKPCPSSLSECPDHGCAKKGTPEAVENELKHRRPKTDNLTSLTVADFVELQCQTDARFGAGVSCANKEVGPQDNCERYTNPSKNVRDECLHHFKLPGHSEKGGVSEKDYVEIGGYLAVSEHQSGPPKANGSGESVNCRVKGTSDNDFHINIVASPQNSEYKGIVVEMIPQGRNDGWTLHKLRQVRKNQMMVRVRGQLMLDNKHRVNKDPQYPIGGQPKRSSLWEIHPVMAFDVCTLKQNCKAEQDTGWQALEDWQEGSNGGSK